MRKTENQCNSASIIFAIKYLKPEISLALTLPPACDVDQVAWGAGWRLCKGALSWVFKLNGAPAMNPNAELTSHNLASVSHLQIGDDHHTCPEVCQEDQDAMRQQHKSLTQLLVRTRCRRAPTLLVSISVFPRLSFQSAWLYLVTPTKHWMEHLTWPSNLPTPQAIRGQGLISLLSGCPAVE